MVEAAEGHLLEITEQEVEKALKSMKNGRVVGPSGLDGPSVTLLMLGLQVWRNS